MKTKWQHDKKEKLNVIGNAQQCGAQVNMCLVCQNGLYGNIELTNMGIDWLPTQIGRWVFLERQAKNKWTKFLNTLFQKPRVRFKFLNVEVGRWVLCKGPYKEKRCVSTKVYFYEGKQVLILVAVGLSYVTWIAICFHQGILPRKRNMLIFCPNFQS